MPPTPRNNGNNYWNGWAALPSGAAVRVRVEHGWIVDSAYITCVFAGTLRFHAWFLRQTGASGVVATYRRW